MRAGTGCSGRPRAGHAIGGPERDPGGEGAARDAQGRGAAGRGDRAARVATKRRNARATAFWRHAARRQNSCSSATRETTPQILAARGSPSRWRGCPRVGSRIAREPLVQQKPHAAMCRPPRPASKAGASRRKYNAREEEGKWWCM